MLAPEHFFRTALAHSILNMNHKSSSIRYLGAVDGRKLRHNYGSAHA
jgi:hypothetical protein